MGHPIARLWGPTPDRGPAGSLDVTMIERSANGGAGRVDPLPGADSKGSMRSLERALDILDVLSDVRGPIRLADVARATGLHPTTALRSLQVLVKRGYASSGPDGYWAGTANLLGANAFVASDSLTRAASRILAELAEATKLTSSCQVRHRDVRVVTARVEGLHPLRYTLPIGDPQPLHLGAGRVLIAWLPEDQVHALVQRVEPMARADGRPLSTEELLEDLARIREDGYRVSVNDRVMGASGVSVPVWSGSKDVVGTLVLSGPTERYDREQLDRLVPELLRAANALSRSLPSMP